MKRTKNEISQSFPMLVLIILSGGLQDAYSYFCRDGVFANAQTGNIVFLSVNLAEGNMQGVLKYLIPVFSFALGVILAKVLFFVSEKGKFLFWKQTVLFAETAVLFAVGFMPQSANVYANALVSFSCAMQVLTFNQIYGNDFASTMCIGNIVKMSGAFVTSIAKKDKAELKRSGLYLAVVLFFAIGAGAGYLLQKFFGDRTILFSAALTFTASLAFIGEEKKEIANELSGETERKDLSADGLPESETKGEI